MIRARSKGAVSSASAILGVCAEGVRKARFEPLLKSFHQRATLRPAWEAEVQLCPECYLQGYCRRLRSRIITDAELSNPAFIRDLRAYAAELRVSCDRWLDYLLDAYRDYPGLIVDGLGREGVLNTEVFDEPSIRYWFRDFAGTPCQPDIVPRVRREAWERVRALATILRAVDPVAASRWGIRAANDGPDIAGRTPSGGRRDGCPYTDPGRFRSLIGYGGRRQA